MRIRNFTSKIVHFQSLWILRVFAEFRSLHLILKTKVVRWIFIFVWANKKYCQNAYFGQKLKLRICEKTKILDQLHKGAFFNNRGEHKFRWKCTYKKLEYFESTTKKSADFMDLGANAGNSRKCAFLIFLRNMPICRFSRFKPPPRRIY